MLKPKQKTLKNIYKRDQGNYNAHYKKQRGKRKGNERKKNEAREKQ